MFSDTVQQMFTTDLLGIRSISITYSSRVNNLWSIWANYCSVTLLIGNLVTWYYKNIKRRNSWECMTLKITLNWSIQVAAQTITHTTVDIFSHQREWLTTIHTKILLTALVVLTSSCMSGLATATRRSSTTLWWPLRLAVHSGVRPSYSERVSVL